MSTLKHARTESAAAFAEAVGSGIEDTPAPAPWEITLKRLEPSPVSWSDSNSLETADEVAQIGIDTRGPSVKAAAYRQQALYAALVKEASIRNQGPYDDMIKEAFWGALARGGMAVARGIGTGARVAGKGLAAGAKATGAAARGTWGAGKTLREGVKGVGAARGWQIAKTPTTGQVASNVAPDMAYNAYNFNSMYG